MYEAGSHLYNMITMATFIISGSLPTQALKMIKFMNVTILSKTTYYKHGADHIIPSTITKWHQSSFITTPQNMERGLGCSDSVGHSEKDGGYIIEQCLNTVIDVQVVQV